RRTRRDSAQLGIGFPDSTLTPVMDWPTPAAPPALPVQRQVPGLMPGHVPCYRQTNDERPVASAPHRRRTDVGRAGAHSLGGTPCVVLGVSCGWHSALCPQLSCAHAHSGECLPPAPPLPRGPPTRWPAAGTARSA